tara:strand:- start:5417 stop:6340 length:924 start_codon:yes stop_codon:yes gene_type:complete
MAMRSQVYEWTNLAPSGTGSTLFRRSTDTTVAIASGAELSIFIGGVGYNITKPAETTATQFVVIEDVALTPCIGYGSVVGTDIKTSAVQAAGAPTNGTYPGIVSTSDGEGTGAIFTIVIAGTDIANAGSSVTATTAGQGYKVGDKINILGGTTGGGSGAIEITLTAADLNVATNGGYAQIRINTTDYFQNPDVTDQSGIPGTASPYPVGIDDGNGDNVLKSFDLYPDIYVLPGQVWDVLYTACTALVQNDESDTVAVFVKYTLYDGPDALIANKLLELGITVNPNNVDWYKRTLIEQQSAVSMGGVA